VAAPPTSIEWNRLSPPSLEAVKLITMRMAAGYSYDEVALMLDAEQPELRHLKPPTDSRFTTQWVSKVHRELRAEIEQSGAATY
jgi:hypothetical protein